MKIGKLAILVTALALVGCGRSYKKVEFSGKDIPGQTGTLTITPIEDSHPAFGEKIPFLAFDFEGDELVFAFGDRIYGRTWDKENNVLKEDKVRLGTGNDEVKGTVTDVSFAGESTLVTTKEKKGTAFLGRGRKHMAGGLTRGDVSPDGKTFVGIRNNRTVKGTVKDGNVTETESLPLAAVLDPHAGVGDNLTTIYFIRHLGDEIAVGGKTRDGVHYVRLFDLDGKAKMYLGGTWGHMTGCAAVAKKDGKYFVVDNVSNVLLVYKDTGAEEDFINIGKAYEGEAPVFLRNLEVRDDVILGGFSLKTEEDVFQEGFAKLEWKQ